jgi:hypothetical protein
MGRYLALWHVNLAVWPIDPAESQKLNERMWAGIDGLFETGIIKEFGWFTEGRSGYAIGEGEAADIFRGVSWFIPFVELEVHEIIPYEKGKETLRALWKPVVKA